MKPSYLIIGSIASLLSSACTLSPNRGPSSKVEDLKTQFERIRALNKESFSSAKLCTEAYEEAYRNLYNIPGDILVSELKNADEIKDLVTAAFDLRVELKENYLTYVPYDDCFLKAKDVFRALRYVEDYLIEVHTGIVGTHDGVYQNILGTKQYVLVNKKYRDSFARYHELKSGDVLLTRGNAYSSAAIARIAETDYQFSHISFVYEEPKTKKLFTSEAHIEIGSVVAPIEEHFNSGNSRTVVFRYKDADLAHKASEISFNYIKANQDKKKNIEYDFAMNSNESKRLYCSEVVSYGFERLNPAVKVPEFSSRFMKGTVPFLQTIGIAATRENINDLRIFAPGDMQFDPQFDLVAEWRNPAKLFDSRVKDFILTKLFEKMEKEGYQFDPSFVMSAKAKALWLARRAPIVKKFLENRFPLNMNSKQMQVFMLLDTIGDDLFEKVLESKQKFHRPMTPDEIFLVIDQYFAEDYKAFKDKKSGNAGGKVSFHQYFHP